jgi:hypothetical protein
MVKKSFRGEGFTIEWDEDAHTLELHLEGPLQEDKLQVILVEFRRWVQKHHRIEIKDGVAVDIVPTVGDPIRRFVPKED